MAVVIFAGADVIMFDGKYVDTAKHVSERVLLHFGLK
jgi:hypothetical protein